MSFLSYQMSIFNKRKDLLNEGFVMLDLKPLTQMVTVGNCNIKHVACIWKCQPL